MKKKYVFTVVALAVLASPVLWAMSWEESLKGYSCIEVEQFHVKEKIDPLPSDMLQNIQTLTVTKISEEKMIPVVMRSGQSVCQGRTLVLGGTIVSYNQGNTAVAIFLPMGGDAKMAVEASLKDKLSGEVMAKKKFSRRDTGERGSKNEGLQREISNEVTKFVKRGK